MAASSNDLRDRGTTQRGEPVVKGQGSDSNVAQPRLEYFPSPAERILQDEMLVTTES